MTKAPKKSARARTPLSILFESHIRDGLEQAAKDDMRPVSHLVQKIVADWLKEKGYVK